MAHRGLSRNRLSLDGVTAWIRDPGKSLLALSLLFAWVYGRFIPKLYFVMDDYIETWSNILRPLWQLVGDCFAGQMSWSGYRPLAYSLRALMAHLFGMEHIAGYHVVDLGLHLANTILLLMLLRRLLRSPRLAFFGAAVFLLLPSHNEAILYMAANANLFALFFGLAAILLVMRSPQPLRWWRLILIWLSYGLSVLAYEVMLPLPIFILLPEISDQRALRRRDRVILYGGLAVVMGITLALRYAAMQGTLVPTRADYAISTDLLHLLRNYILLGGQILLLHTSPWPGAPILANLRNWLPWQDPSVLAAAVFTGAIALWMLFDRRREAADTNLKRAVALFVLGMTWLSVVSLPFVALSGRNPENRYVYIPSAGFALAAAALLAIAQHLLRRAAVLRTVSSIAACAVLVLYARVNANDLHEWTLAGQHARTFLEQTKAALPTLSSGSRVIQLGVPGVIGPAYVFATTKSFSSAIQMLYHDPTLEAEVGDDKLRAMLADEAAAKEDMYLLVYDAEKQLVSVVDWAEVCTQEDCALYPMATAYQAIDGLRAGAEVRFAGGINYEGSQVASVYRTQQWAVAPLLVTCWEVEQAGLPDYTLFLHLTDPAGNTVAQVNHVLRQSFPLSSGRPALGQWPLDTRICDAAPLPPEAQESTRRLVIRGGVWLPGQAWYAQIESHEGVQVDASGRVIFGRLR